MNEHQKEVETGERFEFGKNWKKFLSVLDEQRIADAQLSLKEMLEVDTLEGKTFLDIGSGSGLFSLAAHRLGAKVHSFDYDPQSVECTRTLRRNYAADDETWRIESGSVLDSNFMGELGRFDIVYSWGVLHHTGSMWTALENAGERVSPNGKLFIALYNKQPLASHYWLAVKKLYNKSASSRPLLIGAHLIYPTLPMLLYRAVKGHSSPRGMTVWYDLLDWLGGYPFEVASPEEVFEFFRVRGYSLARLTTVAGKLGCNQFVFDKEDSLRKSP